MDRATNLTQVNYNRCRGALKVTFNIPDNIVAELHRLQFKGSSHNSSNKVCKRQHYKH
jgi:hypothetical protein